MGWKVELHSSNLSHNDAYGRHDAHGWDDADGWNGANGTNDDDAYGTNGQSDGWHRWNGRPVGARQSEDSSNHQKCVEREKEGRHSGFRPSSTQKDHGRSSPEGKRG